MSWGENRLFDAQWAGPGYKFHKHTVCHYSLYFHEPAHALSRLRDTRLGDKVPRVKPLSA